MSSSLLFLSFVPAGVKKRGEGRGVSCWHRIGKAPTGVLQDGCGHMYGSDRGAKFCNIK